jgi:hypothetical protein
VFRDSLTYKKCMAERRRLERFELTAPALLSLASDGRAPRQLNLTTRDVSSSGAYLYCTSQPPVEGHRVRMELMISLETLSKFVGTGGRARIRVNGTVVRVDKGGIAVRFESKYKITALGSCVLIVGGS